MGGGGLFNGFWPGNSDIRDISTIVCRWYYHFFVMLWGFGAKFERIPSMVQSALWAKDQFPEVCIPGCVWMNKAGKCGVLSHDLYILVRVNFLQLILVFVHWRPSKSFWDMIVDRLEKKLSSQTRRYLSLVGRIISIRSALASPLIYLCQYLGAQLACRYV